MSTKTNTPSQTPAQKKEPVPASRRISDQLKRAAVTGKISKEELAQIETLAKSLTVFVS